MLEEPLNSFIKKEEGPETNTTWYTREKPGGNLNNDKPHLSTTRHTRRGKEERMTHSQALEWLAATKVHTKTVMSIRTAMSIFPKFIDTNEGQYYRKRGHMPLPYHNSDKWCSYHAPCMWTGLLLPTASTHPREPRFPLTKSISKIMPPSGKCVIE